MEPRDHWYISSRSMMKYAVASILLFVSATLAARKPFPLFISFVGLFLQSTLLRFHFCLDICTCYYYCLFFFLVYSLQQIVWFWDCQKISCSFGVLNRLKWLDHISQKDGLNELINFKLNCIRIELESYDTAVITLKTTN